MCYNADAPSSSNLFDKNKEEKVMKNIICSAEIEGERTRPPNFFEASRFHQANPVPLLHSDIERLEIPCRFTPRNEF